MTFFKHKQVSLFYQYLMRYMAAAGLSWCGIYFFFAIGISYYSRIASWRFAHPEIPLWVFFVLSDATDYDLGFEKDLWVILKICVAIGSVSIGILSVIFGFVFEEDEWNGYYFFCGWTLLLYYCANILQTCKPFAVIALWRDEIPNPSLAFLDEQKRIMFALQLWDQTQYEDLQDIYSPSEEADIMENNTFKNTQTNEDTASGAISPNQHIWSPKRVKSNTNTAPATPGIDEEEEETNATKPVSDDAKDTLQTNVTDKNTDGEKEKETNKKDIKDVANVELVLTGASASFSDEKPAASEKHTKGVKSDGLTITNTNIKQKSGGTSLERKALSHEVTSQSSIRSKRLAAVGKNKQGGAGSRLHLKPTNSGGSIGTGGGAANRRGHLRAMKSQKSFRGLQKYWEKQTHKDGDDSGSDEHESDGFAGLDLNVSSGGGTGSKKSSQKSSKQKGTGTSGQKSSKRSKGTGRGRALTNLTDSEQKFFNHVFDDIGGLGGDDSTDEEEEERINAKDRYERERQKLIQARRERLERRRRKEERKKRKAKQKKGRKNRKNITESNKDELELGIATNAKEAEKKDINLEEKDQDTNGTGGLKYSGFDSEAAGGASGGDTTDVAIDMDSDGKTGDAAGGIENEEDDGGDLIKTDDEDDGDGILSGDTGSILPDGLLNTVSKAQTDMDLNEEDEHNMVNGITGRVYSEYGRYTFRPIEGFEFGLVLKTDEKYKERLELKGKDRKAYYKGRYMLFNDKFKNVFVNYRHYWLDVYRRMLLFYVLYFCFCFLFWNYVECYDIIIIIIKTHTKKK